MNALILWLVLAPPPVHAQIQLLGHDEWHVREAATRELIRMDCAHHLRKFTSHQDPEVRHRVDILLERDDTKFLATLSRPLPCIDCLSWDLGLHDYNPSHEWRAIMYHYLNSRTERGNETFSRYRDATELMLLDLRRAGLPDLAIRALVKRMEWIEEDIPVCRGGRKEAEPIPAPRE